MRRTKEDAEQTRQDLLEAASTVFARQSFAAARLEDIAAQAGVTRGAIYHHFGGKAELFQALVAEASAQGGALIQAAIAEGGDFATITQRILVRSLQLLEENRRFRETMALTLFQTGGSPELVSFVAQRREQAASQVAQLAVLFRAGIEQGALRPELSAENMARAFLAYQNGLALLWLANPGAFSIRAEAEALSRALLGGITTAQAW